MMMIIVSHVTSYNRYPEVFKYATQASKLHHPEGYKKKILSFGCSLGYEVKTLSDIYFPNDTVDGIDYYSGNYLLLLLLLLLLLSLLLLSLLLHKNNRNYKEITKRKFY